jgi:hypothetical protein
VITYWKLCKYPEKNEGKEERDETDDKINIKEEEEN